MRGFPFLLFLLAFGAPLFAQPQGAPTAASSPSPQPAASPSPAPSPTPAPVVPLTGVWAGSAKLTTEGANPCRYSGPAAPPAVTLEITATGETGKGRLALELLAPQGSACPALRSRAEIKEMKLTESTAAFRDAQGRDWNLAVKEGALRGTFSGPGASGEVELRKTAAALGGPGLAKGVAGVIGANIVGVGALVGANRALQDNTSGTTTITCSPRACFTVSGSGQPCDCGNTRSNVITGGSCGQTASGVAQGGKCSLPDQPCQAQLSCDDTFCQLPFPDGGPCPRTP